MMSNATLGDVSGGVMRSRRQSDHLAGTLDAPPPTPRGCLPPQPAGIELDDDSYMYRYPKNHLRSGLEIGCVLTDILGTTTPSTVTNVR